MDSKLRANSFVVVFLSWKSEILYKFSIYVHFFNKFKNCLTIFFYKMGRGSPPPFKALNPVVLGWVGGVGEGEGVIPPRGPTCQPFKILIVDMTLEQNRSELPVNINQRVNSMVGGGGG